MQTTPQKQLGATLDFVLTFDDHRNNMLRKTNKAVGLLRTLYNLLPRWTFITKCKSFVISHLDYGDIIYGQFISSKIKKYNIMLV